MYQIGLPIVSGMKKSMYVLQLWFCIYVITEIQNNLGKQCPCFMNYEGSMEIWIVT